MIEHTVTFRLIHEAGSPEEAAFFAAARELATIPGVKNFVIRRQTSPKWDLTYGISMRFDTHAEFEAYNSHPQHQSFVAERWLKEVAFFQEADFEDL